MKSSFKLFSLLSLCSFSQLTSAQIYSFENGKVPEKWSIDKGRLNVSNDKYKLGSRSLKIEWKPGATLTLHAPEGLLKASQSKAGGINTWIYNDTPTKASLLFSFKDKKGKEVCRLPFYLDFKGWRCLWAKFVEDMKMPAGASIESVELVFPEQNKKGTLYIDFLEFSPKVSWQNMSDAQYKVNRTDFSLISNFLKYRNAKPQVSQLIAATDKEISVISDRLTEWYLGSNQENSHTWVSLRKENERKFIKEGVREGEKIQVKYNADGTPVGQPLYPMASPSVIDNQKVLQFRTINEKIFLPLALDYRKNNNTNSLKKALYIYDWYNDQGWADGSGLGTLCFEKLRSSGYFHSFFLLKEHLSPQQLERELKTLNWFTLFGVCYQLPQHPGEVADNLRALALPKLIYALSLTDKQQRETALTAFKNYMDNALGIAPGFYGTIKADFSGYHHRGPYNSAYYPHALYAGALIAYLLHDTPYALSETTMHNLKQGLLTFRFFSAGLQVPAGTVGRFPKGGEILQTLLPAFAYVALSTDKPDQELIGAYKRIIGSADQAPIKDYIETVKSNLAYTSTVGEVELMSRLSATPTPAEKAPCGSLFMPYSGLLISKDTNYHFNMKGFSRYIWDFESSDTENLKGRYLAYGQVEFFDFKNGKKSFNPQEKEFDWNYIPGTTTKVLPDDLLQDKGGSDSGHRNFSDETFLSGVQGSEQNSLFSFKMHDITYDSSFRANKSVFVFNDFLLCMGSDIVNNDSEHFTVTTLFQSFDGNMTTYKKANGTILADHSFTYLIPEVTPEIDRNNQYVRAYINHGKAPASGRYVYFMVKGKNDILANKLLSTDSPIEIIEQDKDAHIVHHKEKGIVAAALYNAERADWGQTVKRVNIPLSYLLEQKDKDLFQLAICEPDMRRKSRAHMGLLTDEDVIDQEKAHETVITLSGNYQVSCKEKEIKVVSNPLKKETQIIISTIRGENYTLLIQRNK